jgi:hypothetical protein
MGNDQSSQKNKRYDQYQHQQHYAAGSTPARRHSSAAVPPSAPSFPFPSAAPPPPYMPRDAPTPPLPTPDAQQQMAETNPFRMPSPQPHRRTQSQSVSNSRNVAPRRSQLLAGHVRMPTVPATMEPVPPIPMPIPMPAPAPQHVQPPVPTPGPARAEPLARRNSREDPLTMLQKYDTVIVVCLTSPALEPVLLTR